MRALILAIVAVVAIAATGCAAGSDISSETVKVIVLSPSPAAAAATELAATRWRNATGLPIELGAGGVSIDLSDGVTLVGDPVCATTDGNGHGPLAMHVDSNPPSGKCRSLEDTIAHEVGHVICQTYAPGKAVCHTESGLMRASARVLPRDSVLNAAALEAICAVAPCAAFVAE